MDQCCTVLFTDDGRFYVSTFDSCVCVWRRLGERHMNCNIVEHNRFGDGSAMLWMGFVMTDVHSCTRSIEKV